MRTMTCIEDLRQTARRRVPRAVLRICRRRLLCGGDARAPTAPISSASSCASACWSMSPSAAPRPPSWASRSRCRWRLAPIGLCGMQHGDGEILACRAAQAAGIPFYAVDHVDLLDRGRGRGGRQAVLVPALRHEGPRLHPRADRARGRRQMQRAGAHGRSAGSRPAPSRHQERPDRAAGNAHPQSSSTSRPSRPGR